MRKVKCISHPIERNLRAVLDLKLHFSKLNNHPRFGLGGTEWEVVYSYVLRTIRSKEPWSESSSEFCWGLYQRSQSWVLAKATPPDILRYFCLQIHRDQHAEIHLLFKNWSSVKWPLTSQLSETHVMRNSLMIIQIRNCCFSRLKLSQVHVLQSVIFQVKGISYLSFANACTGHCTGQRLKTKSNIFIWFSSSEPHWLVSVPFHLLNTPQGALTAQTWTVLYKNKSILYYLCFVYFPPVWLLWSACKSYPSENENNKNTYTWHFHHWRNRWTWSCVK